MESKVKELEGKLRTLEFAVKRSDKVIKRTVAKRYPDMISSYLLSRMPTQMR